MSEAGPNHRDGGRPWRSLAELNGDAAFSERLGEEFPALAGVLANASGRRRVLRLMGAAAALAGLAGCGRAGADTHLIPAVIAPPGIVPGLPDRYATASVVEGYASGIVVQHRMGRPVKVEGNPGHPSSLGATDAVAQAQILSLYDPERAIAPSRQGNPASWPDFQSALAAARARFTGRHGAGLRVLTGTTTSPTLAAQIAALLARFPEVQWHQWEAVSRDTVRAGAQAAFGQPVETVPVLAQADVLLAIDSDLIDGAPGHVRFARDLAGRRNPTRTAAMSRLYAVEPTPGLIGGMADHRFIAAPADIVTVLNAMRQMLLQGSGLPEGAPPWIGPVIDDLRAHPGRALVHVGPNQPAAAHALVHAINAALGAPGHSLRYIASPEAAPIDQLGSLRGLVADMQAGQVETLLVLDANPVFTAPADLGFAEALRRVPFSVALTPGYDETAADTTWHIPEAHPLEDWRDARAHDGTATILQPQIQPLFGGRNRHEMLALLTDGTSANAVDLLRGAWRDDAQAWHDSLAAGVVPGSASQDVAVTLRPAAAVPLPPQGGGLTVLFQPDSYLRDGLFADNPWLQELPRPLTKVVWDNPLLIAPALAGRLGLVNGDMARLTLAGRQVDAPVWIMPGQAESCITAQFGFGRRRATTGQGVGFDFYPLRLSTGLAFAGQAGLVKAPGHHALASTEHHNPLDADPGAFLRHGTLAAFQADAHFLAGPPPSPSLYDAPPASRDVAWGMGIDLNACTGCNACVTACQAENNVPVVGRDEVLREHEMHWLRIDRYWAGPADAADSLFQPVLCMHCEEAPCEVVCPVGATVHDSEGLNVMVYNRCIGTRFCSNNCPYKVRRFNYSAYAQQETRAEESRNPEVTVRARGVMEKCTFCIQRIAAARIDSDRADGAAPEVVTACQAACPSQAISFGNIRDPASVVAQRKASPLDYALLGELNTRPRVTYEARLRNANPALDA